ncbi:hypothetical protein SAMN05421831_102222 [Allopseudospirillum japonicum]|uniref:Uncharacterized protein n=1 Tax=Allopseudospirillum japonicum TaxID=64971 RepID=A0A1H6R7X5_9GAMM|nr:hypothetical protein [Allopseudospirillum japonicum]SEI47282.1 hypothetical protein SAMN05421831_102222 [Allopseudospirillum japonicum]
MRPLLIFLMNYEVFNTRVWRFNAVLLNLGLGTLLVAMSTNWISLFGYLLIANFLVYLQALVLLPRLSLIRLIFSLYLGALIFLLVVSIHLSLPTPTSDRLTDILKFWWVLHWASFSLWASLILCNILIYPWLRTRST